MSSQPWPYNAPHSGQGCTGTLRSLWCAVPQQFDLNVTVVVPREAPQRDGAIRAASSARTAQGVA